MKTYSQQPTANEKGISSITKFFIAAIITAGVVYSEVLFLGIIGTIFPAGVMQAGAIIGAVTTGASVLVLCIGKTHTFSPGIQMHAAWAFTGIEIAVLIMNDMLAYAIHQGHVDPWLQVWQSFCPAAPVISIIGWIVIVFLNPERATRHKHMEMQDEFAESEIEFQRRLHRIHMQAKYQAMDDMGSHMHEIIAQEAQAALKDGARKMGSQIVSGLTDTAQVRLSSPRIVDADKVAPTRAASKEQVLDPYEVKPEVDAEVKSLVKKPSLTDRIWSFRDAIDKRIDGDDKPILEEKQGDTSRTRRIGGDPDLEAQEDLEEESIDAEALPENYLDWTDTQWKQAKQELEPEVYNEIFDEVFPADGLKPTPAPVKKRTGGKQSKKALPKTGKRGG
jgi:hypothetical protein